MAAKRSRLALLAALALVALALGIGLLHRVRRAAAASVWVCGDGLKVSPGARARDAPLYDPRSGAVRLAAARGEYVAFQVVLAAGPAPLRGVTVAVTPPTGYGTVLAVENIDLFYQHTLKVTVPSQNGPRQPVPAATPGEYPAQLVPLAWRGTRREPQVQLPVDVPAERNLALWIDIYVPERQRPGRYRGRLEVRVGGTTLRGLDLDLEVWRFALPRETHFKTFCEASVNDLRWAFGLRDMDGAEFRALEDRFFQLAHQHRMNFNLAGNVSLEDDLRRYRAYLDGTAFRSRAGEGAGLNLWMVGFGHEDVDPDDPASVAAFARRIVSLRARNRWPAQFACYVADEPRTEEAFSRTAERCRWIRAAVGSALPTYVTTPDWQRLPEGLVDIWGELPPEAIAGRQAAGQRVWAVNADYATGPYVDTPGLAGRALIWMGWRLGLDAWQFWNCCYWVDRQNLPGPGGERLTPRLIDLDPPRYLTDTWNEPLTFDQTRQPDGKDEPIRINGDGVLFYPGRPVGIAGPLASFPLKSLRRGLQDYEYLWLLRQRGIDPRPHVDRLAPAPGRWERRPEEWERTRLAMGRELDRLAGR